ncbi:MAG: hypothetical protein IT421_11630 [Candidatus Brocadia sp.]|nr:hypothetical protein [Candidatus Brocadia sp.]
MQRCLEYIKIEDVMHEVRCSIFQPKSCNKASPRLQDLGRNLSASVTELKKHVK